ncbi:uncharacterized protein LOC116116996 [Pistacia vera]|uniref:uncharacterized protein LOC116116996 n=1 Tax=Pistacia vera TaxID=55513 RepID=UPI001262DBE1|nr:uncharacterized protein LOC116116996 [Pistacia vera]
MPVRNFPALALSYTYHNNPNIGVPTPGIVHSTAGNNAKLISTLVADLDSKFALKALGAVKYFLGFEVKRNTTGLLLTQTKYAYDLLLNAAMVESKPCSTPMATRLKLGKEDSKVFDHPTLYRSIIGGLKQKVVSLSPTKAKYRSLSQAATKLVWIQNLSTKLGIHISHTPIIWCDNMSAGELFSNYVFHTRTKHIEIDVHFVKELVTRKLLHVQYIAFEYQIADVLTKAIPCSRFAMLQEKLNVTAKLPTDEGVECVNNAWHEQFIVADDIASMIY